MSINLDENETNLDTRVRPLIGITMGDPNGIGPEVVLQCLRDVRLTKYFDPVVLGSDTILRKHASILGFRDVHIESVKDVSAEVREGIIPVLNVAEVKESEMDLGRITAEGGALSMKAVEKAVDLCMDGTLDAMVTAPISKEAISLAGYTEPGHSEFIARKTSAEHFTMMMVAGEMRIGLVTAHVAIVDVPRSITEEAILTRIRILDRSLVMDFGIVRPKIAVLGLNPHAGDGGVLGREEIEIITPAIRRACEEGYLAFGPFAADGFFAVNGYRNYDAVLAMYHDQGLVPFKTLAFDSGVNFTAGLPIVRTSPDHGTAFDLAGAGKALPGSMRSAIFLAMDIARRRAARVSA